MSAEHIRHFVFVDFENVPRVDLGLVEGRPVRVTLLLGKNQKKLDLALVRQIHRLAGQVELVEVGASGRNALDLTLAYYLGQAAQQAPDAMFQIVSRDKDFEPMIGHLLGKGLKVTRCDSFDALPFLPSAPKDVPVPLPSPPRKVAAPKAGPGARVRLPLDRRDKVIARLGNPVARNRPSTRKALLAHIRNALGKDASGTGEEDLLRELHAAGILTIDGRGRVVYL